VMLARSRARGLGRLAALAALSTAFAAGLVGCAEAPTAISPRSLEQSGPTAFLCLAPHTHIFPGAPLSSCSRAGTTSPYDFTVKDGVAQPHLYALVTQTTRGEVAVVDTTSVNDFVLDQDPNVPGANFLPVGGQPVDIVATHGGTAAFVAVAEVGRPGIFALPGTRVRPCVDIQREGETEEAYAKRCAPPTLSTWPSCSLPSAPSSMLLIADPAVGGENRATCDGERGQTPPAGENGDIDAEGGGRQKLVVAMPDMGGIAVFDAQTILDGAPGAFEPCLPERWIELDPGAPPPVEPPPIPDGPACVVPEKLPPTAAPLSKPRPVDLTYAGGRLYVADLDAPVVHVLDMATPCEPAPRPPLLPTSFEDPTRVVTTTRVAVTPELTAGLRRYVYAIDAKDGSAMVFDVSDTGGSRYPLLRPHAEWNPFDPPDRIQFVAPTRDLVIIERDAPEESPVTGVAPEGTRCDPDPRATCDGTSATCDPGALYRTDAAFSSGANPYKLRGTFAFLMLTSGQIVVVEIDDLDAMCRIPKVFDATFGCPPSTFERECAAAADCSSGACSPLGRCVAAHCVNDKKDEDETDLNCGGLACDPCEWAGSGEASCNVVTPHTQRSSAFVATTDEISRSEPGIQAYPLLFDGSGTIIPISEETAPTLRAPKTASGIGRTLVVASAREAIDDNGQLQAEDGPRHAVAMALEDPRAHIGDQLWAMTYEGPIPGFADRVAALSPAGDVLTDPNSRFCDRGVQSEASVREILLAEGSPETEAPRFADYVQIRSELPADDDAHWTTGKAGQACAASPDAPSCCTFQVCKSTFGSADAPRLRRERDLPILEAFQDRVLLGEATDGAGNPIPGERVKCCFPSGIGFSVRPGGQWTAVGAGSGFFHHVIADPVTGVCRDSCDPLVQRLNGRVRSAPAGAFTSEDPAVIASITDGGKYAFLNPMFRFVITEGAPDAEGNTDPDRDMQFSFVTQGAFSPLLVDLRSVSSSVQPRAMTYVPSTDLIAISDGSLEGLLTVRADTVSFYLQYY
jgi:hypothetical protein